MYAGLTQWNATVPFTWKNLDRVFIDISIPIAQWGVNVNLASDFTEYASNDGSGGVAAGTAYNTGSVYGPDGSNIPSVNSSTSGQITVYRVTFQRLIQPSDKIFLELKSSGSTAWKDASHGNPLVTQGGFFYGCWWDYDTFDPSGKSVKVLFGNGGALPGSSYNVAGTAWSNYAASKYRVRKVSNGNMAEQPPMVRADYTGSAVVIPTGSQVALSVSAKVEDTHSALTPGTATFVAPLGGVYQFDVDTGASVVSSTYCRYTVYANRTGPSGSLTRAVAACLAPANNEGCNVHGGTTMRLQAGDSVQFVVQVTSNVNTSGNYASSRLTITRIGS
jgi:hypothetical protein